MLHRRLVMTTGFALFSMFFGSGNLVFPIQVGQESQGHYLVALWGLLLTGILVPFLGVFGMMLFHGKIDRFFSAFGSTGIFLFSFLSLALMGPFGVLARCLTVAHGALQLLWPSLSLPMGSLGLVILLFLLTVNESKIVSILGQLLTPILLLSIGLIALFGLAQGSWPESSFQGDPFAAFFNGFFQGYQTMDLLAAFFFSSFVLGYLYQQSRPGEAPPLRLFFESSLLGASALGAVYGTLVLLGSMYAPYLADVEPQQLMGVVALQALGPFAAPIVALAVVLACVTTGVVLTTLFADFLREKICRGLLYRPASLAITLMIGFSVSTLNFSGIAAFLGPLLVAVYPALIALTCYNIAAHFFRWPASHWPFTLLVAMHLLWRGYEAIALTA